MTCAVSPHFELFTTESPGRARDVIIRFEQIRAFFVQASTGLRLPSYRVRIVGFRSENEYRPYSPMEGSGAYYQPGIHHDTITMRTLGGESYPVATHEFVHLMLHNSKAKVPLWLNEGLAELYSTLKPAGRNNLLVGEMIPGRLAVLARLKLLDLETLMAIDAAWLSKSNRDNVGAFYAQSWALTHMLALSDDYRPQFTRVLGEVFAGADAGATIQKVYGRSLAQIRADLNSYLRSSMFKAFVFPFGLDKQAEQPEVRPATDLEWGMALADLSATRPEMAAKARDAYAALAAQFPKNWEPHAGQGYVAAANQDRDQAGRHFARAEELGCNDPRVFLHWAMYAPPGGLAGSAGRLYQKAVELQPDDLEIRYRAGVGLAAARDCTAAMAQLLALKKVSSEEAPDYLKAVIACGPSAGYTQEARAAAKQLMGRAKTPAEKEEAERYARWASGPYEIRMVPRMDDNPAPPVLRRREEPEAEPDAEGDSESTAEAEPASAPLPPRPPDDSKVAEGRMVNVECAGQGARIRIQAASGRMEFVITEGRAIRLLKAGADVVDDLTCGPQAKPPLVRIRYGDPPAVAPGVAGTVRVLEFL